MQYPIEGQVRSGFEPVREVFERNFTEDVEVGASLCIVRHGGRAEEYTEERGRQVMSRDAITVRIQLGRGDAAARVWTTDLSYDYVRINADYRS